VIGASEAVVGPTLWYVRIGSKIARRGSGHRQSQATNRRVGVREGNGRRHAVPGAVVPGGRRNELMRGSRDERRDGQAGPDHESQSASTLRHAG
jgi:hypothetical protein